MPVPLVSVIVPTFNRAYCLEPTLQSVLGQTHTDLELILVDDGSADDTRSLAERQRRADPRVVYHYQSNQGVSAARNQGMRLARGEFLAFLDSDDLWQPWKLELQLAVMRHLPEIVMSWTDMTAVDADGVTLHERYLVQMYDNYDMFPKDELFSSAVRLRDVLPAFAPLVGDSMLYSGDIFSPMVLGNLVHTSTTLLRRETASRVVGFDTRLEKTGEDFDFHLRTCREGPVALIDYPSTRYTVGKEDQLTRPALHAQMARNFLTTLEATLARDRERITLPQSRLDAAVAEAHRWVGEALFEAGRYGESRGHLLRGLRSPRLYTALKLALALLPRGVVGLLRSSFRRLTSVGGRSG